MESNMTMTEKYIEAVNNALVNEMELDPDELSPEKTFFDDLGLDSIDMVDLIIGLQRKFGVSLQEDDEIKKVRTLGDVYDFFEQIQVQLQQQTACQAESPLQTAPEPVGRHG